MEDAFEPPLNVKHRGEDLLIRLVQARASWFPQGEVVGLDRPDAVVRTGSDDIGVEVTQLVEASRRGAPSRPAICSFRHQVIGRAAKLYSTFGLPPANVLAYFSCEKIDDGRKAASDLAQFVANHIGAGIDCETYGPLRSPAGFSVVRVATNDVSRWAAGVGGSMPVLTSDLINTALKAKEKKLAGYRRKFQRVWLLLATSASYSAVFSVPRKFEEWRFESSFDGVALYDGESGRVLPANLR